MISNADVPPLKGRLLAGRYELLTPLARGGMAEVWEGRDNILDRAVAVKILHPHLVQDGDFIERFRREAIAAARLNHPNVVSTFDAGTDQGSNEDGSTVPFIVMELVKGPTLKAVLASREISIPDCVGIAVQVADALAHAHAQQLIHRDIKPANILICDLHTAPGRAMVADFGIARATSAGSADLTQVGGLVGTAKYLAPEQVQGKPADGRTDVYALGVVLYEMLCGRPPFRGDNDIATALAHLQETPPLPRTLRAGIPRSLELIVLRAMARDPEDRFQSAGDLRDALRAIDFSDDAVSLIDPSPTPAAGLKPIARRSRRSTAPIFLIMVLLACLAGVSLLLIRQIEFGPFADRERERQPVSAPVTFAEVRSFDPEGDESEGESKARLAIDGDVTTAWTSDRYRTRKFGNLKSGVGLILTGSVVSEFQELKLSAPTASGAFQVYVGDGSATTLEAWGRPVAGGELNGETSVPLDGASGKAILVWVTDPGPQLRASISEITVIAEARS